MALLDATVVNVALPRIGDDLDADLGGLQWTLNGYTLTLAVVHPARRLAGRPARPAAGVRPRHDLVRRSPRRCAGSRRTSRCWSPPGCCRASAARCSPRAASRSSPRRSSPADRAPGDRRLVRAGRDRRRGRPVHRRLADRGVDLAAGLPGQPAARGAGGLGRRSGTCRSPSTRPRAPGSTCPARRSGRSAWPGSPTRSIAGGERGVDPVVVAAGVLGVLALAGFVWSSGPATTRWCRPACSRPGSSRWPTSSPSLVYAALGGVLLPARPAPAGGRRLQPAGGRHLAAADHPASCSLLSARSGALAAPDRPAAADDRRPADRRRRAAAHAPDRPGRLVRRPTCCPRCVVFGLGLTTLVAPLTATVLGGRAGQARRRRLRGQQRRGPQPPGCSRSRCCRRSPA